MIINLLSKPRRGKKYSFLVYFSFLIWEVLLTVLINTKLYRDYRLVQDSKDKIHTIHFLSSWTRHIWAKVYNDLC